MYNACWLFIWRRKKKEKIIFAKVNWQVMLQTCAHWVFILSEEQNSMMKKNLPTWQAISSNLWFIITKPLIAKRQRIRKRGEINSWAQLVLILLNIDAKDTMWLCEVNNYVILNLRLVSTIIIIITHTSATHAYYNMSKCNVWIEGPRRVLGVCVIRMWWWEKAYSSSPTIAASLTNFSSSPRFSSL